MKNEKKLDWRGRLLVLVGAIAVSAWVLSTIFSGYQKEEKVFLRLKNEGCTKTGFIQAESFIGQDRYTYQCRSGKSYTINKNFNLKESKYYP